MKKLKMMSEISKQIKTAMGAFCGLSSESLKFGIYFLQCFGTFFTLVYAIRQLTKELNSPL